MRRRSTSPSQYSLSELSANVWAAGAGVCGGTDAPVPVNRFGCSCADEEEGAAAGVGIIGVVVVSPIGGCWVGAVMWSAPVAGDVVPDAAEVFAGASSAAAVEVDPLGCSGAGEATSWVGLPGAFFRTPCGCGGIRAAADAFGCATLGKNLPVRLSFFPVMVAVIRDGRRLSSSLPLREIGADRDRWLLRPLVRLEPADFVVLFTPPSVFVLFTTVIPPEKEPCCICVLVSTSTLSSFSLWAPVRL
mmetsp:Transcript_21998/g.55451  ORF Transcript_21998/g.55451 Transcript_21998/m.55451 type:complete len:246 (+) Transcript_21998:1293-2030(+)